MPQKHEKPTANEEETEVTEEQDRQLGAEALKKAELDEETDDLLDEIDDVLEENAEEFVKSFIQKGGQ